MRIEVLGSGTSTGVPVIGCSCEVCTSDDPRDKRLRTSIYISLGRDDGIEQDRLGILFDSGTDLRQQMLRSNIKQVDCVLYTHTHADHVNGLDDLRVFNFINKSPLPLYGTRETLDSLESCFHYAFNHDPNYEGGAPPKLEKIEIAPNREFKLFGFPVMPLKTFHGSMEVLGYRLKDFAYLPDCNRVPDETLHLLKNLDTLIVDGLRDRPHKTHFTQKEAIQFIQQIKPKKSYLIHMSHDTLHKRRNEELKTWTEYDVELAYDGLKITQ